MATTNTSTTEDAASGRLEEAMARYAEGDEPAFREVYDLSAARLEGFLLRLCRDRSLAEDLASETFVRLHRARGRYRTGAPVLPWLFAIGRRLLLDAVRARRIEQAYLEAFSLTNTYPAAPVGADELLVARSLAAKVERVLRALPSKQAAAFRLLKEDNLSVQDAARLLGVTPSSVKLRAHRAYGALRSALVRDPGVLGGARSNVACG